MSTHNTHPLGRVAVNQAAPKVCPSCETSTVVRADSVMCDRCTAKQPASIQAWADWKAVCAKRVQRWSAVLPPDTCPLCREPFGPGAERGHATRCADKLFVCACGNRYGMAYDLREHQAKRCSLR